MSYGYGQEPAVVGATVLVVSNRDYNLNLLLNLILNLTLNLQYHCLPRVAIAVVGNVPPWRSASCISTPCGQLGGRRRNTDNSPTCAGLATRCGLAMAGTPRRAFPTIPMVWRKERWDCDGKDTESDLQYRFQQRDLPDDQPGTEEAEREAEDIHGEEFCQRKEVDGFYGQ